MAARVHRHRASDRAGHTDRPFEADDALLRQPPSQEGQVEAGPGPHDDLVVATHLQGRARTLEVHDEHVSLPVRDEQVRTVAEHQQVQSRRLHQGGQRFVLRWPREFEGERGGAAHPIGGPRAQRRV